MTKRKVLVFVLALATVGGVFAQTPFGISIGIGGFFGSDFGGGYEFEAKNTSNPDYKMSFNMGMPYFGGGGFVFFDATYAELSLGYFYGSGKYKTTQKRSGSDDINYEYDFSVMNFNIGLLGKYPFAINQKFSVFPLLGIEYDICLSEEDEDDNLIYLNFNNDPAKNPTPGDFSALWFKLGGGLDLAFTESIYLRFEVLYGIRLANKFENNNKDNFDDSMDASSGQMSGEAKTLLGHGLTAKLAIGYKFKKKESSE